MLFSSDKEINRLMSKGISNIYEKLTFSNLRFSRKENLKKCTSFVKCKKVQGIFGETFILTLLSSAVFRLQTVSQIFFLICFAREIKSLFIRVP